jgi:hypothetical protein
MVDGLDRSDEATQRCSFPVSNQSAGSWTCFGRWSLHVPHKGPVRGALGLRS